VGHFRSDMGTGSGGTVRRFGAVWCRCSGAVWYHTGAVRLRVRNAISKYDMIVLSLGYDKHRVARGSPAATAAASRARRSVQPEASQGLSRGK
jgi:hypothetical protein